MKDDNASSTAYTVLQGLLYTAMQDEYISLVDEETRQAGRLILSGTDEGRRRLKQLDSTISRFFLRIMQRLVLPGITLHYALRKRFIEIQTIEAIKNGATQVVSLGAGFDTLAYRLHSRYPDVQFIEIDHPATSREKKDAFSKSGDIADNLQLLAVDLAEHDLANVFKSNDCLDPAKKTTFICEGVLMYLNTEAVKTLFKTLKQFNQGAQFIFTAITPMTSINNNASWLLKLYLKIKDEPLNWNIEHEDVNDFLRNQGYELTDKADGIEMYQRFLGRPATTKIHHGEFAVASQASIK